MVIVHHVADAGLMRIEAGEERRPGGAAAGGVVELGEAEAVFGEAVEGGGGDFTPVGADIGLAEIVGHDENNVGPGGGGGLEGEGCGTKGRAEELSSLHRA
jgi:hypothetical protein